jgi:hypothetical protein
MFGSDHYGMKPDLITIAKGLTSAYAPLSGTIVSDKVWQVLVQGSDQLGADRPRLDLFRPSDLRRRRASPISKLIDETGPGENAGETGAYFRKAAGRCAGRPPQCRRSARRRADGGGGIRRGQGRPLLRKVLRPLLEEGVAQDRPADRWWRRPAERTRRASAAPCRRATSSASRRRSA